MRIFSTVVLTLHWRGARNVPLAAALQSKVTLSMPVLWFGDGTMEFMVLWNKPGSKLTTPKWEFIHDKENPEQGVWWLQAPSKFTRKETYPEIIRFFASRGKTIKV